jgi:hypothetical protein
MASPADESCRRAILTLRRRWRAACCHFDICGLGLPIAGAVGELKFNPSARAMRAFIGHRLQRWRINDESDRNARCARGQCDVANARWWISPGSRHRWFYRWWRRDKRSATVSLRRGPRAGAIRSRRCTRGSGFVVFQQGRLISTNDDWGGDALSVRGECRQGVSIPGHEQGRRAGLSLARASCSPGWWMGADRCDGRRTYDTTAKSEPHDSAVDHPARGATGRMNQPSRRASRFRARGESRCCCVGGPSLSAWD